MPRKTKTTKIVPPTAGVAKKASPRKVVRKKKAPLTPQQRAQRKQKFGVRALFDRMGFQRFKTDGIEFNFKGRTGEIDDVFLFENVMILAEYTTGSGTTSHVSKKSLLYRLINENREAWVRFAASSFPALSGALSESAYVESEYRVCICYFSSEKVSDEVEGSIDFVHFIDGTRTRYFDSLTKTIYKSARHEFFSFLGLAYGDVGTDVKTTGGGSRNYQGHLLPENHSSFPQGFKVVSFYADPGTLLELAYVLRRDSWRDDEAVYQRVLQRSRMSQMRRYLTSEKRVFVNNIIVTLPSDTVLNDPDAIGENIDPKDLQKVRPVVVSVPQQSNTIGIVDGQHRVFCYHEGKDKYESKIKMVRSRQNLLVTGIIYPKSYKDAQKRRFEAKLFLEINDKQKRTKSDLRQSIELILNPVSPVAIAKAVVQKLNSAGALKGLLQTNFFDPPSLLRTTSIVSYGLKPLLKLDGDDSLFSLWKNPEKEKLRDFQKAGDAGEEAKRLLEDYVGFCCARINGLLVAAKLADPARWKISEDPKSKLLTPTIVNGFFVCLRLMIRGGKVSSKSAAEGAYKSQLAKLPMVKLGSFKSSAWRQLGEELYKLF